ncbi:hypothetical protein ACO34A_18195 [Rhizobium sp. ACO-34A]|nr:hypothetical protein ACO34A_18195 [Rhizobium sp. ACO-34A]PZU83021.1 MAG: hypothetical protein DI528_18175 [Shinella sp.]
MKAKKMSVLTGAIRMGFLGRAIAVFSAANAAAAAVEAHRTPNRHDLRALGIKPEDFSKVRLG